MRERKAEKKVGHRWTEDTNNACCREGSALGHHCHNGCDDLPRLQPLSLAPGFCCWLSAPWPPALQERRCPRAPPRGRRLLLLLFLYRPPRHVASCRPCHQGAADNSRCSFTVTVTATCMATPSSFDFRDGGLNVFTLLVFT